MQSTRDLTPSDIDNFQQIVFDECKEALLDGAILRNIISNSVTEAMDQLGYDDSRDTDFKEKAIEEFEGKFLEAIGIESIFGLDN